MSKSKLSGKLSQCVSELFLHPPPVSPISYSAILTIRISYYTYHFLLALPILIPYLLLHSAPLRIFV